MDGLSAFLDGGKEPAAVLSESAGRIDQLSVQGELHTVVDSAFSCIEDESNLQVCCAVEAEPESRANPEESLSFKNIADVFGTESAVAQESSVLQPVAAGFAGIKHGQGAIAVDGEPGWRFSGCERQNLALFRNQGRLSAQAETHLGLGIAAEKALSGFAFELAVFVIKPPQFSLLYCCAQDQASGPEQYRRTDLAANGGYPFDRCRRSPAAEGAYGTSMFCAASDTLRPTDLLKENLWKFAAVVFFERQVEVVEQVIRQDGVGDGRFGITDLRMKYRDPVQRPEIMRDSLGRIIRAVDTAVRIHKQQTLHQHDRKCVPVGICGVRPH